VKVSITGTTDSFQISGGRVDAKVQSEFDSVQNMIVVELNRLDAAGNIVSGPFAAGVFASVKICSSTFVATKEPQLFRIDAGIRYNTVEECAKINVMDPTAIPAKRFVEGCWVISVCHASTYTTGTPVTPAPTAKPDANGAVLVSVSIFSVVFGLLAL
jgi:hypothetical protein